MPNNALYWYGYMNGCESLISANNWSAPSGVPLTAPTYNANSISISGGSGWQGIGKSSSANVVKSHTIAQGISGSFHYALGYSESKNMSGGAYDTYTDTSVKHQTYSINQNSVYIYVGTGSSRSATIYAFWYE